MERMLSTSARNCALPRALLLSVLAAAFSRSSVPRAESSKPSFVVPAWDKHKLVLVVSDSPCP